MVFYCFCGSQKPPGQTCLKHVTHWPRDTPVVLGFYGTSPLLLCLHVLSPQGVAFQAWRDDPIVERGLIPDDSVNCSLLPQLNQRLAARHVLHSCCIRCLSCHIRSKCHPAWAQTGKTQVMLRLDPQAVAQDLGRDILLESCRLSQD